MLSAFGIVLAANLAHQNVNPITVEGMLCHPRHVLVKLSDPAALKQLPRKFTIESRIPQIGWAVIEVPEGALQASRQLLSSMPGITTATYDRAARPAYEPNDELYAPNGWGLRAMHANLAWDVTKGSSDVVVAVIDTGVRVDHVDLADNIWTNSGEIPGNGIDDDGNGYVDDVNGYDFAYGDSNPADDYGHGTACAGLVGALQDNFVGCSGVAPHTRIMALKAALSNGYFYDSANTPAYIYAADNGAKVLSMSFFSDRVSQMERDGIDYAWAHGVLPVAAAGNDSTVIPYYPAAYENTLAVAALNTNLTKAGFSNYGSWVDVSAPGVSLATTTMDGGYTTGFSGTSGACPMVAGTAALCFAANPNATNVSVRRAIEASATLQDQAPFGEFSNNGMVNAELAVQTVMGANTPDKPAKVRYLTQYSTTRTQTVHRTRLYGRNLGADSHVTVTNNGLPVLISSRGQNWAEINLRGSVGVLQVKQSGSTIWTFGSPIAGPPPNWPMSEASAPGASVTGGFAETLKLDSIYLTTTRRSDGYIAMQGTFHDLTGAPDNCTLVFRRRYRNTTAGTETIYLYDWTSASYPYGNWVPLASVAVPTTATTSSIPVSNFSRFIDPEGTTYVLIQTSDNLSNGAVLDLDQILIRPGS